ncbi:hypothetical protein GTZ99_00345 [Novosphingobium sp. FSY-8]|uniref:Uncharacterized protein n=1 Tax=Novosphingobium ovatum TaxID=1908523 RepID=A0ABW9X8Z9_9SPHN|nr:hypothetical protein [Novosphingobium ovatum]NBC35003.1 hypothetical protein [Novosphingobium ovatum]
MSAGEASQTQAFPIRITRGRIAYRDADGGETGREWFDLCHWGAGGAGGHLLRALCVMDDVGLIRDVTIAMDGQWRPVDGHCRLLRAADPGVMTFHVGADAVRVHAHGPSGEAPVQEIATTGPLPYLGLHPLMGDALIVQQRGVDAPGEYRPIAAITNSVSPNGDEAVGAQAITIDAAYVGAELVTVAAGTFAARRYALRWRADWPAADLWVRASDGVFLLMRWALTPAWFELAQVQEHG